jgi:hypothetical protein
MAHVGATIDNPLAGESLTFVATCEDGSATLVCDIATVAGAPGPPEHLHPSSNELFEVQEGAITVEVDMAHKFSSHPELDGRTRVTFDVPGRIEDQLVTFSELARAGRLSAEGRPSMQQVAVTFSQLTRDTRATVAPWAAQRALFALLAPIGRLRGLKPFYAWGELN